MLNRTVLYLRLSDEDRCKLNIYEASQSIKNQEIMLRQYAINQGWNIVGVYNDEDYSGADRNRPNFKKMIFECSLGLVDIVLVKTQARFARDIELIDKYIHNKFKEWHVRFVTYIENIDNTKNETKKTSQITSMVDEWYIEDTSKNIRATLKTKREHGQFTGSFAPYGYKKDIHNKNHLVIDNVAAENVKRIFNYYANGFSFKMIIQMLHNENILSPMEYKMLNNSKLKIPVLKTKSVIKNVGTYIIKNTFFNKNEKIKIYTAKSILTNNKEWDNKLEIKLIKKDEEIKLYYYSSNSLSWSPILLNSYLPDDITCIMCVIDNFQKFASYTYEFEVVLQQNKTQDIYSYKNNSTNVNVLITTEIRNKFNWSEQTLKKMLHDEVYLGNLLQYKTTYVSYKNHCVIRNKQNEWIRFNNAHEAIIDSALWNSVQLRLNKKVKSCKSGKSSVLSNKLFCRECGAKFIKCGRLDDDNLGYFCCKDKKNKWTNCSNKSYLSEKKYMKL